MKQLSLFDWAAFNASLTDLGGRCSYCLEHANWLAVASGEHYIDVKCQTVMTEDDGTFYERCGAVVTIEEVEERWKI